MVLRRLSLRPEFLALFVFALPARAEKAPKWIELRSPHFTVVTNAGERPADKIAGQFERIRAVFHGAFPRLRVDPSSPIVVLAAKDERTFNSLLPAVWLAKGQLKRAGMFIRGPERNFVLLRLDSPDDHPYETVYHEYAHLLVDQNYQSMQIPLWLDEGLAEFYGNSEIHEKEVWLGRPSESHVLLLRQHRLLPLQTLFAVTHSSPEYNEENKGSIFYAESWALVHYELIRSGKLGRNPLSDFLSFLGKGKPPDEAAALAFGDLKQLQKDLEAYVRQTTFNFVRMKGPAEAGEAAYQVRELSAVESAVVRGNFLAHNQRYADARALLNEALREQPDFAPAHEALGLIEFRQGHDDEATRQFEEAVRLDSQSYFAHYYVAVVKMRDHRTADAADQIEASLRKAIKINPEFAPSFDALATFLAQQRKNLDEAHMLSLKAISLEPGNARFYLTSADILYDLNRLEDALRVGEHALSLARSPEESTDIQAFLDSARQHRAYLAASAEAQERAQAAELERQAREAEEEKTLLAKRAPTTARAPSERPADPSAIPPTQRDLSDGVISQVVCGPGSSMKLTLAKPEYKLDLHSRNYFKIEFLTTNWDPPSPFNPCKHLKGARARVVYSIGDKNGGEIISVDLHK